MILTKFTIAYIPKMYQYISVKIALYGHNYIKLCFIELLINLNFLCRFWS